MISTVKFWKNIGLSMILVSGMSILTGTAEARVFHSRSDIISAQKRLQMKGYFPRAHQRPIGPQDGKGSQGLPV